MTSSVWSFVLSWSRVGVNAMLFLAATRVLTLAEIGLFATAFAPIRLIQGLQKGGTSDAVVMFGNTARRWPALLVVSLIFGGGMAGLFALLGALLSPILMALSIIPLLNAVGAIPEGILRQKLAMKSLALRTLAAQVTAAALALWMLFSGFGVWALVGFAICSATLTNALSVLLAGWRPHVWPRPKDLTLILPKTGQIMGRALLNNSQMPMAQLAIGVILGPAAAGAFQIATRMFELIDALTLSPLRFIALPQLATEADLRRAIGQHTQRAAMLAAWVWGGTLVATTPILTLATGAAHAAAAAPVLQALACLGLASAIMMPLTQALTAQRHTGLLFARAALTLGSATLAMLPALTLSPTACALALSFAGIIGHLWLLVRALPLLGLDLADLAPIKPLIAGALMVALLWLTPTLPLWQMILLGTITYAAALFLPRHPKRSLT